MPAPDPNLVLKVLREGADFARRMGFETEASELDQFHIRFQSEKPTLKALRRDLEPTRSAISSKIRKTLFKDFRTPHTGKEALAKEYGRIFLAIENVVYPLPPQPAKLDISGFKGSEQVKEKIAPYW